MSNFRESSTTKSSQYKINIPGNTFSKPKAIEPNTHFSIPTSYIKDQNCQNNNKFQVTNPPNNVNNKILVNKDKTPSLDDLFANLKSKFL